MHSLMLEADAIHEREAALHDAAIRNEDRDDYDAFEAEKHIQEVVHIYADIVMEKSKRKRKEQKDAVEKIKQMLKPSRTSKRK